MFHGEKNDRLNFLDWARDGIFANQVILKSCLLLLVAPILLQTNTIV